MRLRRLRWDDENIEHIARHEVSPEEAEQACRLRPKVRRGRCGRYLVLGCTAEGRYLLVVVTYLGGGEARVITARDMDQRERAIYRRK
ncbi:MAG: BrnT family toxin [Myxococcota bacterium]